MKGFGEKIHVLHLIGSTGLYGAERWILALMRAVDAQRIRSTLVNLVDFDKERSEVVQAAEQRGLAAFNFATGGKFNPFAAKRLANWAREQQVDIIHGHGFKSDLLGLLTAKFTGCRVMTTPHGWSLERDIKLQFYEKLDRFSFMFMDMVCPLSEALYEDAAKWCKKNLRLVANGVDIDEVRSSVAPVRVNDGTFVIGYIGRLVESKNLITLLNAISLLFVSRLRIKLILVGAGGQLNELKTTARTLGIEKNVEYTGFRTDAAAILKGFDCFVLPSFSEGTPRCIMEAMALNIPVIASDIPGNRILVSNGETGLLFPVNDSKKLADCITFVMDHPAAADEMVKRASMKVEEEYSSKKMALEYTSIYEKLTVRLQ